MLFRFGDQTPHDVEVGDGIGQRFPCGAEVLFDGLRRDHAGIRGLAGGGDLQQPLECVGRMGRGEGDRAGGLILGDLAQRSREAKSPPLEELEEDFGRARGPRRLQCLAVDGEQLFRRSAGGLGLHRLGFGDPEQDIRQTHAVVVFATSQPLRFFRVFDLGVFSVIRPQRGQGSGQLGDGRGGCFGFHGSCRVSPRGLWFGGGAKAIIRERVPRAGITEGRRTGSQQGGERMKGKTLWLLWLFLPALFGVVLADATEYTGKVVAIADGDTLTLLVDHRQLKIRLAEIDTPERGQPYGSRAKEALSQLAFGKRARVVAVDRDRYGRTVGRVYVSDTDVNAKLVRRGAAWVYRKYAKDQSLFALEAEARRAKRGLWGLPEAERVPPWEWRKQ
jgi:endonuclease YncB( thermonuclease family)